MKTNSVCKRRQEPEVSKNSAYDLPTLGSISEYGMPLLETKIRHNELAFDIDGVIADTFHTFVNLARDQYGVPVQYEDITEYDFRSVIDIDDKISSQIIELILDDPLGMGIQPVPGSVPVLGRLMELGPLLLVTARPHKEGILKWLLSHFQLRDRNGLRLIATGTHTEKLPILLDHGIKYFVEDRLETCYLLHDVSVNPIVFRQPWNQKPHPFHTVKSWDEISAMIQW